MEPVGVVVKWKDAFDGPAGWVFLSSYVPDPVYPTTTGWMYVDKPVLEGYVTVYSTHFLCGDEIVVSNPIHIPEEMVLSVTYLESGI